MAGLTRKQNLALLDAVATIESVTAELEDERSMHMSAEDEDPDFHESEVEDLEDIIASLESATQELDRVTK